MKSYDEMEYHPIQEEIVGAIKKKIQSNNDHFFRLSTAFYFSQLSTMMRTGVEWPGINPPLPTNIYAINMAASGSGKTLTTNFIEDQIIPGFKRNFLNTVLPEMSAKNLADIATVNAAINGTDDDVELSRVQTEYNLAGPLLFSFDSGTTAAVKQIRHKLLLANIGSINMIMDEFGSNLLGNLEVLSTYLELFDGRIKQKLLKNTKENQRSSDIDGITPTNMLLFGTPAKIFNNPKIEDECISMFETGYARRCFFSFLPRHDINLDFTPAQRLESLKCTTTAARMEDIQMHLASLADVDNTHRTIAMSDKIATLFLQYQLDCEKQAYELPEHMDLQRSEMANRYFKAVKLAGTYAFIDKMPTVTEEHAYAAIKMAEDSGKAFNKLINKEGNHIKLAHYVRDVGREVTQVDLVENLPFFKGSEMHRRDLMNLAMAYAYKNNIIIKRYVQDDIECFKGETLPKTELDKLVVSYSNKMAEDYKPDIGEFEKLHLLTQYDGLNWCVHHFQDEYRSSEKVLPGFNLAVIDVDGGTTLEAARILLNDYTYHLYTTKSHTAAENRFRIVMPLSHTLKMGKKDYQEFMTNIYEWLPFTVDSQTNDIARKWLSHKGHYEYNKGVLLNAFDFIPKTKKLELRKQEMKKYTSMSGIERWVLENTAEGNRSNQLIRFAYVLVDSGLPIEEIRDRLLSINQKLEHPLTEQEIFNTILVSAEKKIEEASA